MIFTYEDLGDLIFEDCLKGDLSPKPGQSSKV